MRPRVSAVSGAQRTTTSLVEVRQPIGREHLVDALRRRVARVPADGGHAHAEGGRHRRHFAADSAQTDDPHARAVQRADGAGAAALELVLHPLVLRLMTERDVELPRQGDAHAEHVLGDRPGPDAARVRQRHLAVDHLGVQQAADARRRRLDPAQPRERGKDVPVHIGRECDIGFREKAADGRAVPGFEKRVLREVFLQMAGEGARHHPGGRITDDAEEDVHGLRYVPLRPPRLYTRRISPITIALSTAFTMS